MIPNHYEILGINRNATKQEIKKAYRQLALLWHPDKNKNSNAHEKFIEINESYLILSDDEASAKYNKEYDRTFFNRKQAFKPEPVSKFEPAFEETNGGYEDSDLNNWTKNAKNQAEKYAAMSYEDFSKMVKEIIFEVGKQGVNAVIFAATGVICASAIFSLRLSMVVAYCNRAACSLF